MIILEFQKLLHTPADKMLLDFRLEIPQGELVTLFGESGAGKTSILRIIAGLFTPDSGMIRVHEKTWLDTHAGINISPQRRRTGFVFQDYALFPNMTVRENIEYALGNRKEKEQVAGLIDHFELGDLQKIKPAILSGGQKQRVALARALANRPEILLLDEPLSSLDLKMRLKLQDFILRYHRKYELTTILVSHDVSEIFRLSDKVLELEHGKITRQGAPADIFSDRHISGKFQFPGEVVEIQKEDILYMISVLIGNHMVKIIADEEDVKQLSIGDKVLVASKAFNPVIRKIQ